VPKVVQEKVVPEVVVPEVVVEVLEVAEVQEAVPEVVQEAARPFFLGY
jgi:hypothetical protein